MSNSRENLSRKEPICENCCFYCYDLEMCVSNNNGAYEECAPVSIKAPEDECFDPIHAFSAGKNFPIDWVRRLYKGDDGSGYYELVSEQEIYEDDEVDGEN